MKFNVLQLYKKEISFLSDNNLKITVLRTISKKQININNVNKFK